MRPPKTADIFDTCNRQAFGQRRPYILIYFYFSHVLAEGGEGNQRKEVLCYSLAVQRLVFYIIPYELTDKNFGS